MSEKIYTNHVNDWCLQCKSAATDKKCKKCFLPDVSDDGKIGEPSEFRKSAKYGEEK